MILKPNKINAKDFETGKYKHIIPEIYELKNCVENSPWYIKQTVFDHIVNVVRSLEIILKFSFLDKSEKNEIVLKLKEKRGNINRRDLLLLASILHDNAKNDTLVIDENGFARCPGHELIGAKRIGKFASRFGLDNEACKYLEKIVRYHGFISEILVLMIETTYNEKYFSIFKETVKEIALELMIFMYADLAGSDLKVSDKQAFLQREDLLVWMIKRQISKKK